MSFTKATPLVNYDHTSKTIKTKQNKQAKIFPQHPTRLLLVGQSGSGKTNLLLNLVYDILPWTTIYVYAKDLSEKKYSDLEKACESASKISPFHYEFHSEAEEIVDVDSLNPNEKNLIIFDDYVCDKNSHEKITSLFIRGRKKNASLIFLTQSFYDTPKIIRLQCNKFCFFRPTDDREIGEFYKNFTCGMKKNEFMELFYEATDTPFSFFYIDKTVSDKALQCRKNFTGQRKNV